MSSTDEQPSAPPDNPVCWLCLDDGPDGSGEPLRRDCSCRGSSGFAHFDCLVDYAAQKVDPVGYYGVAWLQCPGCLQRYQGELSIDLVSKYVAFTEEKHSGDDQRYIRALYAKLDTLLAHNKRADAVQLACKIISDIGDMRSRGSAVPQAVDEVDAHAHNIFALASCEMQKTTESLHTGIEYLERSLDIYRRIDCQRGVDLAESNIVNLRGEMEGASAEIHEEIAKRQLKVYQQKVGVSKNEKVATFNVRCGVRLSDCFRKVNRMIEAERLLLGIAAACKQVHGPHHALTKNAERALQTCKERYVEVCDSSGGSLGLFQALRYDESEGREKCVVRGPISEPRSFDSESTISVPVDRVSHSTACKCGVGLGNPVVCRGLKHEAHLNGKIGDVKSYDELSGCFYVQFEDSAIGLRLVKKEVMRVLFDVPVETGQP